MKMNYLNQIPTALLNLGPFIIQTLTVCGEANQSGDSSAGPRLVQTIQSAWRDNQHRSYLTPLVDLIRISFCGS